MADAPAAPSAAAAPAAVPDPELQTLLDSTPPEAPPQQGGPLLDPAFLRRLEHLQIISRKVFRGRMKGERRSRKKGISMEFADYRDYVRGDDTRFIDWNIYGRLERFFIKLFMEEEDLAFYVIIDASASMKFGKPITKFDYARRAAAALGYIALANQDKVGISAFSNALESVFRPTRGKYQLPKLVRFLEDLRCEHSTSLAQSCRDFVTQHKQSGIVVIISDFLDDFGYEAALKNFFLRSYDVYVVQVLAEEERNPELVGHLELQDSETGERQEVTISEGLLKQYQATLESYCGGLRDWCASHDMTYLATSTGTPLESLLLNYLRQRGLLR